MTILLTHGLVEAGIGFWILAELPEKVLVALVTLSSVSGHVRRTMSTNKIVLSNGKALHLRKTGILVAGFQLVHQNLIKVNVIVICPGTGLAITRRSTWTRIAFSKLIASMAIKTSAGGVFSLLIAQGSNVSRIALAFEIDSVRQTFSIVASWHHARIFHDFTSVT